MLNKLKFAVAALLLPLLAFGQSYPSPTFQNVTVRGTLTAATPSFTNPVPIGSGGTNLATLTAHGVMLGEGTSSVAFAGPSATAGLPLLSAGSSADPSFSTLGLSALSSIGANTLVGNATGSSATPTAIAVTGCNGAAQALQWTSGGGASAFGCNSNIATSGANANITSLSGLTTPLSVPQGGIGAATLAQYNVLAGNGTAALSAIAPSTSGFVLTSNGSSAFPTFQALPSGRLIGVQVFTSSGTYTPTTGTNSVIVTVLGGGGGGGGSGSPGTSNYAAAAGGAAGAYSVGRITSAFSGVTVTVGAAGSGGTAGPNAGSAGGTSSFGTLIVCGGGSGGATGGASTSVTFTQPPNGGSVTTAGSVFAGSGATGGFGITSPTQGAGFGGIGGASPIGAGGAGGVNSAGVNASTRGAGGGGGAQATTGAAVAGGNGGAGLVVVYEYN